MTGTNIYKNKITKYLLTPVLASLFPPVFLFQTNLSEVTPSSIILPLLISAGVAFGISLLLFKLTKNILGASISTIILMISLYYYGMIYDAIDNSTIHGMFSSPIITAFIYVLICIAICIIVFKIRSESIKYKIWWFLKTAIIVLLVMNISLIGFKMLSIKKVETAIYKNDVQNTYTAGKKVLPDIYYIILDEYASSDTILKYYGYKNVFENALKSKGFFVSHSSTSKFDVTELAIASDLNMELSDKSQSSRQTYSMISNNRVSAYLRQKGYKYINIGSSFETNRIKPESAYLDYNYFRNKGFYSGDGYLSKLIDMSILRSILYTMNWSKIQQASVYYSFDKLDDTMGINSPKFVFAHVLCPHHPFVFDRNGKPLKISDRSNWSNKSVYLGQYIYVSKLVNEFVDKLLAESKKSGRQPVIIIQSDHGPRKVPGALEDAKYKIFNAMYLPYGGEKAVFEGISPVNTFPAVFNYYFQDRIKLVK